MLLCQKEILLTETSKRENTTLIARTKLTKLLKNICYPLTVNCRYNRMFIIVNLEQRVLLHRLNPWLEDPDYWSFLSDSSSSFLSSLPVVVAIWGRKYIYTWGFSFRPLPGGPYVLTHCDSFVLWGAQGIRLLSSLSYKLFYSSSCTSFYSPYPKNFPVLLSLVLPLNFCLPDLFLGFPVF